METALDPVVEKVLDLYRTCGNTRHDESVSPSEHMFRTAQIAMADGAGDEMVLAAFFHGIGQLCLAQLRSGNLFRYGRKSPEKIGADFLCRCGFSERLALLVENHPQSNRYLSFSCCNYYNNLSEASRKTLECQGGPMSRGEARAFEQDPLFHQHVLLRRWDAQATGMKITEMDWEALRGRMEMVLQNRQF